jgi:hypothetical protein
MKQTSDPPTPQSAVTGSSAVSSWAQKRLIVEASA